MSQNDFVIDNASFPATRADLTSAFQALASNSSGSSDPSTTYANMFYYDTTDNTLKVRTEADDGWISVGYVDQGNSVFSLLDDTKVVNTSGTQTGLLGDQATSTWEAGTATTESLVSPAKIKSAIDALVVAGASPIGVGQSWSTESRTRGTAYRNTTGKPIQVNANLRVTAFSNQSGTFSGTASFQVSSDNSTWIDFGSVTTTLNDTGYLAFSAIIPDDHYYKWTGSDGGSPSTMAFAEFSELR